MHWAAPPLYRLLWKMRVPLKPPLFQSFWGIFLTFGGFLFVLTSLANFLTRYWVMGRASPARTAWTWLIPLSSAVFFGLGMAVVTRLKAKQLQFPPWERYPAEGIAKVF